MAKLWVYVQLQLIGRGDFYGLGLQQTIEFSVLLLFMVVDVPVVWSCRSSTSFSCRRDRSPRSCLFGKPR